MSSRDQKETDKREIKERLTGDHRVCEPWL